MPSKAPQVLLLDRLAFDSATGRWHIGDEPLHAGDCIELELSDGRWVTVRFEWMHRENDRPKGYLVLALADDYQATLDPIEGARARLHDTVTTR